jgi:hypothetical protein
MPQPQSSGDGSAMFKHGHHLRTKWRGQRIELEVKTQIGDPAAFRREFELACWTSRSPQMIAIRLDNLARANGLAIEATMGDGTLRVTMLKSPASIGLPRPQ